MGNDAAEWVIAVQKKRYPAVTHSIGELAVQVQAPWNRWGNLPCADLLLGFNIDHDACQPSCA